MLDREQTCAHSARGADLGVDVLDVVARRLRRDHELARGLSNKEIAERLVITPKTASNHIEHIYTKIGVSNRAGAALFATKHGLLPEGD